MSNNAPDYENDLVFPPSMPRCDIEELKEKVKNLEEKLKIATEVITQARDTAYDSCQICPKCELIDKMLTELLEKIKE